MKIKTGDIVAIIAGKERFIVDKDNLKKIRTGKVLKVFHKEQKILVEGVNMVSKHKPPLQNEKKGNIIKEEAAIHISNVALIDPEKNIPTRVGWRYENDHKVRYSKKTNAIIN